MTTEIQASFSNEWQAFDLLSQGAEKRVKEYRAQLAGISEEQEMSANLAERTTLEAAIADLNRWFSQADKVTDRRKKVLKWRRQGLTDEKVYREIQRKLEERESRLAELVKLNAPEEIVMREKMMIWEVSAPIEQIEAEFQRVNVNDDVTRKQAEEMLNQATSRVAVLAEYYRRTKANLEENAKAWEQKRQEIRTRRLEWASQDREHLDWVAENRPMYSVEATGLFRQRFPAEPLATPVQNGNGNGTSNRIRVKPEVKKESPVPEEETLWRFWVTFNHTDPGEEVAADKKEFTEKLRLVLDRADYHGMDASLAYDKLIAVTQMTVQQRALINKIVDFEPLGWKKIRVGQRHRLFLNINEENRHVTFMPRPRRDAYAPARHKK